MDITEIEFIDGFIKSLRSLKSELKRRDKMSVKARDMNPQNSTRKRIENANADLNWQCMAVDKMRTSIARGFKGSTLDVSTDEKEYNPSGFHSYKG